MPKPRPRPSRPNPGLSERRERDTPRRWPWIFVVLLVGVIVLAMSKIEWGSEDDREIRKFGNLECVYNVDTDTIEDCVAVEGDPQ